MAKTVPYAISNSRIRRSPFMRGSKTLEEAKKKVKWALCCYHSLGEEEVGVTKLNSLKAMGLVARANNQYVLSVKYT